jgi:hypothetical protein
MIALSRQKTERAFEFEGFKLWRAGERMAKTGKIHTFATTIQRSVIPSIGQFRYFCTR